MNDPDNSPPTIDTPSNEPSPTPFETRYRNCQGKHFIQQCPEIWAALLAPDDTDPEPWPDAPAFPFRWSGTARRWLLARGAVA